MFCNKCGKNIPDDSTFCPNCGASLSSWYDAPAPHAGIRSVVEVL